ncbi:hypothetical protein [Brachyspira sp.]|uniref:hypothetical protein n=1 Tax=Brachyspira sp. TaxID=1977261 RepID=UPI0026381C7D|nr:hypothetical protein [Brachyspira sp.]
MNKYIISLSIIIFAIISCNNNSSEAENENSGDLFSNRKITFKKLELFEEGVTYTNSYSITNIGVKFSPPINSIKLSDEEKENIISQTGYGKDLFYTDSIFIDEKVKITCLAAYMKKDETSLDNFINFVKSMKDGNNFTEEYYIINGKKNIQFKINMNNTTYIFFTIFESVNDNYFILNYTFPVSYLEDSMVRIANSLSSVKF